MKLLTILSSCILFSFTLYAQTSCNVNFSIGNDSTLLCGQTYTLNANPGMDSYVWSNGSSQPSITVNSSGTYTCYAVALGPELVTNGDFSNGNTGFLTDYIVGTGGAWGQLTNPGTYAINTSPSSVHNNFSACGDHTSGSGNMMIVNGSNSSGTSVWCQTVNVTPNTSYQFSTWLTNALNDPNVSELQFTINGTPLGNPFLASTNGCTWNQFFETWNSGTNTTANICITNLNNSGGGNDFAIDDISFRPVCNYTDEVDVIIPPNPVITVDPDQTICEGDEIDLTAYSVESNIDYTWNPGTLNNATITVSPTQTTTYTVEGTDPNGCVSLPVTVTVNVNPLPQITFQGDDVICKGMTGEIEVFSDITQTDFFWPINGFTQSSVYVQPTDTTIYSVIATTNLGCVDTAYFEMAVIDQLTLDIVGDTVFCEGDQNQLVAESNLENTTYLWLPRNETGEMLNTTMNDLGWVFLEGTHPVCGTLTDSIELILGQKPDVNVQDSILLCLGDEANVTAQSTFPDAEFVWFPGEFYGATQNVSFDQSSYLYVQSFIGSCRSDLDSVYISVNLNCDIQVPNVFTPNSDGVNDYFKLTEIEGISSLECVIVNRWGNVVQEFADPNFKWDGRNKRGDLVNPGTYFYVIKGKTSLGQEIEKSGNVQVFN